MAESPVGVRSESRVPTGFFPSSPAVVRMTGVLLFALSLAGVSASAVPPRPGGPGVVLSVDRAVPAAVPADTFSHPIHRKVACLTCHLSRQGARLTFQGPRGCQICHHQPAEPKRCGECHSREELAEPLVHEVRVTVPDHATRARAVGFPHEAHSKKDCLDCHTKPVTLEPADTAATCAGCHADHHASGRRCAACHRTEAITKPHEEFDVAHFQCGRCHTPARITALDPTRSFCLACHDPEQDHHPERECSACHFLLSPEEFRARVAAGGGARQ